MKICLVIHSHTGNTYSVAQKIKDKLEAGGHSTTIERLVPVDAKQTKVSQIQLKNLPDISGYDVIIFGGPVNGFSLSSVMVVYLSQVASLQGKKVAGFVTQYFPYPWMGGNRAIGQMKEFCENKGADIIGTGVINWSKKDRENIINELVDKFSRLF